MIEPIVTTCQELIVTSDQGIMLSMVTNNKLDEKTAFSIRLNHALDSTGIPEKFAGRQNATAKLIEQEGGKVSQKGARKWLEGEAIPAVENLIRLARGTHTNFEWLATGRGHPISNATLPGAAHLLELYADATRDGRASILRIAEKEVSYSSGLNSALNDISEQTSNKGK